MAGGITGCPDWQTDTVNNIVNHKRNVVLINPRRESWNVNDGNNEFQINWEYQHIRAADCVYFWFPKEGLCPITLFELGCVINQDKLYRVGVEPGYVREQDIKYQLNNYAPHIPIYNTITDLYQPLM